MKKQHMGYKVGDIVTVEEGRYGFKENDIAPPETNPLTGRIVALYDTFCTVKLRNYLVSPFYYEVTKTSK